MIQNITVIGAGSTGHAAAAGYAMKGFNVTLYDHESFAPRLEKIAAQGGILLRGAVRGIGHIAKTTTDPAVAMKGAQFIAVHVMAPRHEEVARAIAPYVEAGQHFLIVPGNLGSFVFRKIFQQAGVDIGTITLSDQEGNLCPCRLTGDAEVSVGMPFRPRRISSLPASDTPRVIEALKDVWEFKANRNVFETALNANNVVIHIASTILSATQIERQGDKFVLFQQGFDKSSCYCAQLIREERLAIIRALGFEEHADPMSMVNKIMHPEDNPQLSVFMTLNGPNSIDHRYLTEDALCGGAFALSIAARLGLHAPVLDAFIRVAGILNKVDYMAIGRTLDNLGFAPEATMDEILSLI